MLTVPFLILLLPLETYVVLTDEDKLVEGLGALCFLLASALFFINFIKSKDFPNPWWRKWSWGFFFLGFLFFMAFGEEISWGQRILGWETPEAIEKINMQDEFTLHNLKWFQPGEHRGGIGKFFTAKWIFTYFGFIYFFITPILYSKVKFAQNLFNKFRLPIPPLWIGILFLLNIPISKSIELFMISRPGVTDAMAYEMTHSVAELMEFIWAVIILLLAYFFWKETKQSSISEVS